MEIEEVGEEIFKLETPLPRLGTTLVIYFIREGRGVLIEPGPAIIVPLIQDGMKRLGMKELEYIIPTHIHMDHAGGLGKLAKLFPKAKAVLHPQGVKHIVDPSRLIQGTKIAFGDDFEDTWGSIMPVPESQVYIPGDGDTLSLDGRKLQIIYSPGHAPHHIAIFDRKSTGLFCGEALGLLRIYGEKTFIVPAAVQPNFDMELYLQTIERLRRLSPQVLFYSHNGVGKEPEKLISMAMENTKLFGSIISEAMKRGKSPEAISRKVREHVADYSGFDMIGVNIKNVVAGYILHFNSRTSS